MASWPEYRNWRCQTLLKCSSQTFPFRLLSFGDVKAEQLFAKPHIDMFHICSYESLW